MKYLYSRSLPGAVETPAPKKKAPRKPTTPKKPPVVKESVVKPTFTNLNQPPKPQPQTPQPMSRVLPPTTTSNIKPLPTPSEIQKALRTNSQKPVAATPASSANPTVNSPSTSTTAPTLKKTMNPIPPPKNLSSGNTNSIPAEKQNNTTSPQKSTQQTTNTQTESAVTNKTSSNTTTTPAKKTDAEKPSTEKSTVKPTSQDSAVKTRTPRSQGDSIEKSQSSSSASSKRDITADSTPKTRATNVAAAAATAAAKEKEEPPKRRVGRPPSKSKPPATAGEPKQPVKQPAKRGRKRVIESENEDEGDKPQSSRKRMATSRRQNKELPILNGTYKLSMVFQGHTDINIPAKSIDDDDLTDAKDIWCCEFEPPRQGELIHNVVAICGSYSVLLLDTQQGRYIKKFTHAEIQEIFYCMAWTTLTGPDLLNSDVSQDKSCNILAVAGRLGSIKLLNPLQNECYRYLFGHKQAVLKLAFAKTEPRWLFSASADKTVRLWDIGSPTSKEDDSVCLAKFNLPPKTNVPSALHVSHDLSMLVVGFDDGDMVSFKITPQLLEKFRTKSASLRDKESRTGDKWHDFGPIATIEPKTMYPKGEEWHAGYIDDIYIFGQDGDKSHRLYNKIMSRGADDMEFIIWDPVKSTKSDADIMVALEWPDSAGCTGARYKVIESEGQKILIAGEYDGQVYIYNVGNMKNSKTLSDGSLEQYKPTRMLSHPMSSELIRDVCCSHDTRTIVAVDNNNTAFIWNCTDNK